MMTNQQVSFSYYGGVLSIGSLLWDSHFFRETWRKQNLNIESKIKVKVPIRYGRIAESRKTTFTMVFSSECKEVAKLGDGYFVPFKAMEINLQDFIFYCRQMIMAERNSDEILNKFYWDWGCLGIAINPFLRGSKKIDALLETWKAFYDNKFNPDKYCLGDEDCILTQEGILNIDWPYDLVNVDFIIATPTIPNVTEYPDPKEIAQLMQKNKYNEYFNRNVENGIATFQDEGIIGFLND